MIFRFVYPNILIAIFILFDYILALDIGPKQPSPKDEYMGKCSMYHGDII